MLSTILNILFVINCLVLIVTVLLQAGKGGGLGAGFSGGTATTAVFGGRGPGALLAKTTISCAALFMIMSLLLAYISSKPQSVLDLEGEDQIVGNVEDDVIEEGTLDIKLKALSPDGVIPEAAPKVEEAPKVDPPKTEEAPKVEDAAPVDGQPATEAAPKTEEAPKADAVPAPAADAPAAAPAPTAPAEN